MPTITVAKTAGFCFGVDRAVRLVEELLDKGEKRMRQLTEKNGEVTEEPLEEVEL